MTTMDWMVRHALLVGCIGAVLVVLAGKALGVDPGLVSVAGLGLVVFVSYLTAEEIERRHRRG